MGYSIKISANPAFMQLEPEPFFSRSFNSLEELQKVSVLCDNKRRIGWLESLIIPVRTDNCDNFCKDFFLPGFFNEALKTHDLGLRVILCIFMLA